MSSSEPTFWTHLDALRGVLLRCLLVWVVCFVACFCLREPLFDLIFLPAMMGPEVQFVSLELASQFMVHLQVAMWAALLLALPYLLVAVYGFVAPALYAKEKRALLRVLPPAALLFYAGVLINYCLIFPYAFRFLADYQVSRLVVNQFSIRSYISALLMLSMLMGLFFEMPVVAFLLSKLGVLRASFLRRYRRHAFVLICIVAAVITPTVDAFTMLLVTLPLYLLYELSILVVRLTDR